MNLSRYISDYKSIARLGSPILVSQLGMIIVGFADNIMVGRYSTEALAAASFVNNVFNVTMFCIMGFTYGILPLAGALFGADDRKAIGALMRNAMAMNIAYTLLITGAMTIMLINIDKMGQPVELLHLIRPYFLLYLVGMLPVALFNVLAQWSYAIRNTVMPMWIVLATNALNIIGNFMLIYGKCGCPEWGLFGAGVSTLIARSLAFALIAGFFLFDSRYALYRQGWRQARVTLRSLMQVWRTSIPVSMQMTFESASFSAAAIMAGWLGTVPLAAYQIIVIVGMLGFCLYYAVGSAVAVLVANEAGHKDNQGMRRVAFAGYHVILTVATCSSLTFVIFGRSLMHLFTDDPMVLATALSVLLPLVIYQLGDATQVNFANSLRGTSHVMPMLWIAFVSYIVVGLPATYLLGFTLGLGIYGIVLSFSVSLFMAGALFLYFFLRATGERG